MQPQRLCFTALLTLLATVSTPFAPALFSMQALAQATDARKSPRKALTLPPLKDLPPLNLSPSEEAEADRLLQQGIEHYKNKQLNEALTALEKALALYQETANPEGARQAIGYLASIYRDWGGKQAIEYFQQYLELSRISQFQQGEFWALENLGELHRSLGEFPKAVKSCQEWGNVLDLWKTI